MMKKHMYIVQIGTGGTGAALTQMISQVLSTMATDDSIYVVADPDLVEHKNLRNQLFIQEDVGYPKAEVLADRYGAAYELQMVAYTDGYIESLETLENLFFYRGKSMLTNYKYDCVLISAVDNNFTRKIMHELFVKYPNLLYIDVGNESCEMPDYWRTVPMTDWTALERETYEKSGYSGQVVVGLKQEDKVLCPSVSTVFPDILEDTDTIAPSTLSCADLSASEPQRYITNRFAATAVCSVLQTYILNSLDILNSHIIHFHALKCYMRAIPYSAE